MRSEPVLGFPSSGKCAGTLLAVALTFAPPASAADMRNGERLYGAHCLVCHGATGAADMPGAPDLRRGRVLLRPDAQLAQSIKRGRGAMPGYYGVLTDREILDVVAYLRTLS